MRVGFMAQFDRERIAFMKQHNFGCVELFALPDAPYVPGKDGWKAKADEARGAFADAGVRISCLAGFYVNHMDADEAAARGHAQHVRNVITLAAHMKVPTVAGFAGRIADKHPEESLPRFKELWAEHAKAAEDAGVRIAFEHCPMGAYHSPFAGANVNCICTPAMWEKCFDAVPSPALGLEWDPSHLICMLIDPVENIRNYGSRIYHVHAKDAKVYAPVIRRYGLYASGAVEHCFPGLGDCDWAQIVKELLRAGYQGDLNIEGWHDTVFSDRTQAGYEDWGLRIAGRHLAQFVDGR